METQKTYNIVKLMGRQNKHEDYSAVSKEQFIKEIELIIRCLNEPMIAAGLCIRDNRPKLEEWFGKQLARGLKRLRPFDDDIHQIFIVEQNNGWGDGARPLMNKRERDYYIEKYGSPKKRNKDADGKFY
jgi:hypothetical protein